LEEVVIDMNDRNLTHGCAPRQWVPAAWASAPFLYRPDNPRVVTLHDSVSKSTETKDAAHMATNVGGSDGIEAKSGGNCPVTTTPVRPDKVASFEFTPVAPDVRGMVEMTVFNTPTNTAVPPPPRAQRRAVFRRTRRIRELLMVRSLRRVVSGAPKRGYSVPLSTPSRTGAVAPVFMPVITDEVPIQRQSPLSGDDTPQQPNGPVDTPPNGPPEEPPLQPGNHVDVPISDGALPAGFTEYTVNPQDFAEWKHLSDLLRTKGEFKVRVPTQLVDVAIIESAYRKRDHHLLIGVYNKVLRYAKEEKFSLRDQATYCTIATAIGFLPTKTEVLSWQHLDSVVGRSLIKGFDDTLSGSGTPVLTSDTLSSWFEYFRREVVGSFFGVRTSVLSSPAK
jgi:hypothetical protein